MRNFTKKGQQLVKELSQDSGFSSDAVSHLIDAMINGNGTMAQFNHYEFGGSGQWMQGGMIMIGDFFNNGLKSNIDFLCNRISSVLAQGDITIYIPERPWYPNELGQPSSSGSQNQMRYAYFPHMQRLAIETSGEVWIYDTLHHSINGFSQQQGNGANIKLSSSAGDVDLLSLSVVSRNGVTLAPPAPPKAPSINEPIKNSPPNVCQSNRKEELINTIHKLGELHQDGILTDDEFYTKKQDLLSQI